MSSQQFDLFAGTIPPVAEASPSRPGCASAPADLDDATLLEAIPSSGVTNGPLLVTEAGRRRLPAAISVLEDYCRRFAGFGLHSVIPEQVAALNALAAIGGAEAARSVARIIDRDWVQAPTLPAAVAAAARLRSPLSGDATLALLRHPDPAVRADACRLARAGSHIIMTLVELLTDLHPAVSQQAACALGRMGRPEARPALLRILVRDPTRQAIEAVVPVADDECMVRLGHVARGPDPDLAAAAREALEAVDHPLAERLLERLGPR